MIANIEPPTFEWYVEVPLRWLRLAPCFPLALFLGRQELIDLMEAIEEIPGVALAEGLSYEWESFPEYLDALERLTVENAPRAHRPGGLVDRGDLALTRGIFGTLEPDFGARDNRQGTSESGPFPKPVSKSTPVPRLRHRQVQ